MTARGHAWLSPERNDVAGRRIDNEFEAGGPQLQRFALLIEVRILIINLVQALLGVGEDEFAHQLRDGQGGQMRADRSPYVVDYKWVQRDLLRNLAALLGDFLEFLQHQLVEP